MTINRREAMAAAVGAIVTVAGGSRGAIGSTTTTTSREYYCYSDVVKTCHDVQNEIGYKEESFFLELKDGREIEVEEHDFSKFFWLSDNKCYMGNQFFTDKD